MLPGFLSPKRGNTIAHWFPSRQDWTFFPDFRRMKPLSYLRPSQRWDNAKKFTLTIAAASVASNLTDFPVLVNLTAASGIGATDQSAIFTELGENALKLAIQDANGDDCFVEVERWDGAGVSAQLWFKAPALSSTVDNVFTLYYRNSHPDNTTFVGRTGSVPARKVWSNKYIQVCHLSQDPSGVKTVLDSLGTRHGTSTGMDATDCIAAHVGYGLESNGSDESVQFSTSSRLSACSVEISAKNTGAAVVARDAIIGRVASLTTSKVITFGVGSTAATDAAFYFPSTAAYSTKVDVTDWTVWNHFSFSINSAGYVITNHTTASTATVASALPHFLMASFQLFYDVQAASYRFPGVLRGLFISSEVRSTDWLATSYLSRTDALITYT